MAGLMACPIVLKVHRLAACISPGKRLEGLSDKFSALVPMWYPEGILGLAVSTVSHLFSMVSREGIEPSTY
jgi:hypothetical protein